MLVRDVMSAPVFTIREDKTLRVADEIMNWAHIRHVPVVDAKGRLVGILSHRDLLSAAISTLAVGISNVERAQRMASTDVRKIMKQPIAVIAPGDSVQQAAHQLLSRKIGCLPVIEDDKLVGIVTAADLLRLVEKYRPKAGGPAE